MYPLFLIGKRPDPFHREWEIAFTLTSLTWGDALRLCKSQRSVSSCCTRVARCSWVCECGAQRMVANVLFALNGRVKGITSEREGPRRKRTSGKLRALCSKRERPSVWARPARKIPGSIVVSSGEPSCRVGLGETRENGYKTRAQSVSPPSPSTSTPTSPPQPLLPPLPLPPTHIYSVLLDSQRSPLNTPIYQPASPPNNTSAMSAYHQPAGRLVAFPSVTHSLATLPNATSVAGVSIHYPLSPSGYSQESEDKVRYDCQMWGLFQT